MTHHQQDITLQINRFVTENSHADTSSIEPDTLLFKEGIFDSMGFVLLVDFLEERFGISIDDSDFTEENFQSLAAITTYIEHKMAVKTVG